MEPQVPDMMLGEPQNRSSRTNEVEISSSDENPIPVMQPVTLLTGPVPAHHEKGQIIYKRNKCTGNICP
jgi:hypothetical protein